MKRQTKLIESGGVWKCYRRVHLILTLKHQKYSRKKDNNNQINTKIKQRNLVWATRKDFSLFVFFFCRFVLSFSSFFLGAYFSRDQRMGRDKSEIRARDFWCSYYSLLLLLALSWYGLSNRQTMILVIRSRYAAFHFVCVSFLSGRALLALCHCRLSTYISFCPYLHLASSISSALPFSFGPCVGFVVVVVVVVVFYFLALSVSIVVRLTLLTIILILYTKVIANICIYTRLTLGIFIPTVCNTAHLIYAFACSFARCYGCFISFSALFCSRSHACSLAGLVFLYFSSFSSQSSSSTWSALSRWCCCCCCSSVLNTIVDEYSTNIRVFCV